MSLLIAMDRTGLGEVIRRARLRRGWTQDQLADALGVQRSYVSQWETGARKWPQEHVRAIADTLGLSQVDMAVAAGLIDAPYDRPAPTIVDPRLQEIADAWPRLHPGIRQAMRNLLDLPGALDADEPDAAALAR